MQKRSSQLNMQLTQLRKENTSIAEVRVWIPASLNFLRLSLHLLLHPTVQIFEIPINLLFSFLHLIWLTIPVAREFWCCFSFTEGWASSSIVWLTLGKFLSPFNPLTGLYHNINFVIHILQLVKPWWNGRNPLSVVVLKIEKKDGRYLCGLENLTKFSQDGETLMYHF